MDELGSQWYQAGSLVIQAGFLIAAVWSIRAILKNMRASQEQMSALLRLRVGEAYSEESAKEVLRPTPYLLEGWPQAEQQSMAEGRVENSQKQMRSRNPLAGLISWLQEPMASSNAGVWRRMVRWLQAPAGS